MGVVGNLDGLLKRYIPLDSIMYRLFPILQIAFFAHNTTGESDI